MSSLPKRLPAPAIAAMLALGLAACGTSTVSTGAYKGTEHEIAQTISNLQSDVTAGNEQKICANDLAHAVVERFATQSGGCEQVIKNQLAEVENYEVDILSIDVNNAATPRTATARVSSIENGRTRVGTLTFVEEDGKWKVSGLG